ncbi:hypothetical protein [Pedobacter sp. WC2423]|uniref:hypothetical protein n=1 Tax=Pedobacter sp. WC2423 TaxID=3234142 RepID=UPI003465956D
MRKKFTTNTCVGFILLGLIALFGSCAKENNTTVQPVTNKSENSNVTMAAALPPKPNYVKLEKNEYNKRYVITIDVLHQTTPTVSDQSVQIAKNGPYHLEFQSDGNLVLYKEGLDYALWASDTNTKDGQYQVASLSFYENGRVIIYRANAKSWTPAPFTSIGSPYYPIWVLQDDGNFVGYETYTQDAAGNVTITGKVIGSTNTQGGQRSHRNGTL